MSSFVWDTKFNSGIESMDVQNRKIFDYMTTIYNELVDIRQKCDPFNRMFDQLELLCKMHFMDAEQLMEKMKYPSVPDHKRQHDLFLAAIHQFKTQKKQCHTPMIINDFIKLRWDYISHMLNETVVLRELIKAGEGEDSADSAQ